MDKQTEALNRVLEIVSGYTDGDTLPAMVEIQSICKGALVADPGYVRVPVEPTPDVVGLVEALDLALEYWRHRQQRYKNRRPKWVIAAESALAAHHTGDKP